MSDNGSNNTRSLGLLFTIRENDTWRSRVTFLFLEAVLFTSLALLVPYAMGIAEVGFFSLFLMAASLTQRLRHLLDENAINIYERQRGFWLSNTITGVSLFSMFAGIMSVYALAAGTIGSQSIQTFFGFALEAAQLGDSDLLTRRFGHPMQIFEHNAMVLVAVWLLSLVYGSYGAVIALGWNACVWAFVLITLVHRAAEGLDATPATLILTTVLGLLPHLIIEGLGYVLASISGLFLDRGWARYSWGDPILNEVIWACTRLVLISLALLGGAALLETLYAPWVIGRLQ